MKKVKSGVIKMLELLKRRSFCITKLLVVMIQLSGSIELNSSFGQLTWRNHDIIWRFFRVTSKSQNLSKEILFFHSNFRALIEQKSSKYRAPITLLLNYCLLSDIPEIQFCNPQFFEFPLICFWRNVKGILISKDYFGFL